MVLWILLLPIVFVYGAFTLSGLTSQTAVSYTHLDVYKRQDDTPDTHRAYPYAFCLSLAYELKDGILFMEYQVENRDPVSYTHLGSGRHNTFMFSILLILYFYHHLILSVI